MKWSNSLAFRFWVAINSIVLTGVLTISILYFARESNQLEDSLNNEALTAANILNSAIGLYMLEGDYSKISPLTYSLQSEPNIAYVIVRDIDGTTINQKGETTIDRNHLMVKKVPLEYFQEKVGEVEIAVRTTSLEEQRDALRNDTILTVIIYSFLSLVISYKISKRQLMPVKKLISATKRLAAGERNVKVLGDKGVIEIQELATEFNNMAQTINNHEKILVSEINKATRNLSEKVQILEVLGTISNSVLEDDVQSYEVMRCILISIKEYIQADQISFGFFKRQQKLEIFNLNQNNKVNSFELPVEDSSIFEAINNQQIIVQNKLNWMNLSNFDSILYKEGMRSLLILPIIAKNKVIGTLNISSAKPGYFTNEVIEKLDVFTNQIALALDRVAAYESLQKSAFHDYLTGLPNYRLFKICIQEALENAETDNSLVSVMFLDLDRFKAVNDTFGHDTGDLLLKYIAKQITSCLSEDETVSRIGGDEFSIVIPHMSQREEAIHLAKKILKVLENPVIIKGYKIPISASIGISFYPEDGTDADNLIKHADRAMYRVKKQGKNNYAVYSKQEDDQLANQIVFEHEMRRALTRKEFVVYYQPKINVQNGTISGVEALVRWEHPDKGLIFPAHFIPQAEDTGLIIPIGEFVMREACRQCMTWQSIGLATIPVSVNLSSQQFLQPSFVSTVEKIINETGMKAELLELEITESMSMDLQRTLEILKDLKKLGVRISVDDFGTGYSSLNYLHQLPIDRVKIDKSFISNLTETANNDTIVSTIINMAHNLNLIVTAEGAETEEQVKYLQQQHCDEVQGYYYSRPIPASEFEIKFADLLEEAQKSMHMCI